MASEIRNRFTDTEMQIARETDLPELLSHLGYQVKRVGRFHTTAEMDSLRIKDRRTWFRYSQNTGGDAITFLQQFCGKSFPEAVEYLLTFHGKARGAPIPQPKPISPKQEFSLPPRNADGRRVFAYLRKLNQMPQFFVTVNLPVAPLCAMEPPLQEFLPNERMSIRPAA